MTFADKMAAIRDERGDHHSLPRVASDGDGLIRRRQRRQGRARLGWSLAAAVAAAAAAAVALACLRPRIRQSQMALSEYVHDSGPPLMVRCLLADGINGPGERRVMNCGDYYRHYCRYLFVCSNGWGTFEQEREQGKRQTVIEATEKKKRAR